MPPTSLRAALRHTCCPRCSRRSAQLPLRPSFPHVSSSRPYSTPSPEHPPKPPQYGQALSATHPHLIRSTELTPGIPASEYEERRRKLMHALPEGSVVVCMGGTVRLMSQAIFYKFRQASDFYYLTGFNEPDVALVLESKPSSSRGYSYTLFVPPHDSYEAQWSGQCTGLDGAVSIFGADEAHSNTSFSKHLPDLLRRNNVFASLPPSPSPSASSQPFQPPSPRKRSSLLKLFSSSSAESSNSDPPHLLIAAALSSEKAKPLEKEVHKLRAVKSRREVALMKAAADLSAEAHTKVMRSAQPGRSEGMLAAEFEYHCAMGGAERPAYVPVVASGANALVIHYTNNDCLLDPKDLVLMDAGCERHMYVSDITRTFPASGKFTSPQRDLYEVVLTVQKELVKRCRVDEVNMMELQRTSCSMLEPELRQIGFKLATGDVQRRLYPHFISHHLGMDLHDCPTVDRNHTLVEGNVITIEPGIYIPSDSSFPKHFHNMGVRIEDDVALTEEGPMVLSANAPKEVVDVEGACQGMLE